MAHPVSTINFSSDVSPWLRAVGLALAAALLGAACAPAGAGPPTVAAVVNGEEIPVDELSEQYESVRSNPQVAQQLEGDDSGQFASQLQAELLTGLIQSRLLTQAAEDEGISVTSDDVQEQRDQIVQRVGGEEAFQQLLEQNQLTEQQVTEQLRNRALRQAVGQALASEREVSDEELETAYEQQIEGGNPRASHILVDTEEEAEKIMQRLEEGADFNELARAESQDPTAERNGGGLGEISRGQTVPAFEEALFNAEPGELVGPVETQFGFHVIKRNEPPPLEQVEDQLREQVRDEQAQVAVQEFLLERAQEADVRVNPRFGQWDDQAGRVVPADPLDDPDAIGGGAPLPAPGGGAGAGQGPQSGQGGTGQGTQGGSGGGGQADPGAGGTN